MDDIGAFAAQQAPALAANITRLCGKVIEKGLTGILEHACALQQQVMALEVERDALKAELARRPTANMLVGVQARLRVAENDAGRYHLLRDWLQHQGQLVCVDCQPGPGEPTGLYWVFRGAYMVKGGTPAGYGKTEEEAIDAAMQAKEPPA